jgi:hypothetical protein
MPIPYWKRPGTDFPNRAHAAGVADAFRAARDVAKAKADALWESLKETPEEGAGDD